VSVPLFLSAVESRQSNHFGQLSLGFACRSILHPKDGQAFDDCPSVREGVKAADLNVFAKSLQVNVAHPANRAATAGGKAMQKSLAFLLFIELLLQRGENPGIYPFDLTLGTPSHRILQGCPRAMHRFDCLGNHPALLRQLMPQAGADLGQRPLFVAKREQMTASRDPVIEAVQLAFQRPRSTAFEQFRMNGTSKQVQAKFGNLGADKKHKSRLGKSQGHRTTPDVLKLQDACTRLAETGPKRKRAAADRRAEL